MNYQILLCLHSMERTSGISDAKTHSALLWQQAYDAAMTSHGRHIDISVTTFRRHVPAGLIGADKTMKF